jgi:hypothetical protein
MRSVLLYTTARFLIFLATAGVLYVATPARGFLLLLLAVMISGIVSYVLLSGQRDAMSSAVTGKARAQRGKLDRARAKEDGGTP